MKKWLPYLLLAIGVLGIALLAIYSVNKRPRVFNDRITLRSNDKIPYGMYVAYNLLPHIFPKADISYNKLSPGNWDLDSTADEKQAVILVAKDFDAEEYELQRLFSFAKAGNYVFVIALHLSYDANNFFNCNDNVNSFDFLRRDSLQVNLEQPPFLKTDPFIFPGKTYESYFSRVDTSRTLVLGRGTINGVNFIGMNVGKGGIFLHLSPLAFSNYFLLHKNNIEYYKNALSVLPKNISAVAWNDYYLTKIKKERDPSWFRVLMSNPSFRWGLLTAMATLLLYILLEMRRKQRLIPEWERPKNDSLDFVKTIGRLYFDKGDHKNLAQKMGIYFMEHLRTFYKLPTHTIDESFMEAVHSKTNFPLADVKRLILFIQFVETAPAISEFQLSDFHKHLELFYQNT